MARQVPLRGKRRSVRDSPWSWRRRSRRSAESSRSSSVNAGSSPASGAWCRRSRLATAWNVPDQGKVASGGSLPDRPPAHASTRAARRDISTAARRENVSRRTRRGSAPRPTRAATRWASVCVLPGPAPATISSGSSPASAARACAGFSVSTAATPRDYTNVQSAQRFASGSLGLCPSEPTRGRFGTRPRVPR